MKELTQETYKLKWNKDDLLFAKVVASDNLVWFKELIEKFNLQTVPDSSYKFIDKKETLNYLLKLKTELDSKPGEAYLPS